MTAGPSPLTGKRVLVARAEGQTGTPARLLRERGAEPVVIPSIVIGPPDDDGPLRQVVRRLRAADWIVFTSANGVEHAWRVLSEEGLGVDAFGDARLAVVGTATEEAVKGRGIVPHVVAKEFRGEGLASAIIGASTERPANVEASTERPANVEASTECPANVKASTERPGSLGRARHVLLLRAQEADDVLPVTLRAAGMTVEPVAVYRTRPSPEGVAEIHRRLTAGTLDAVIFSSGSTVESICEPLGAGAPAALASVAVACIGPVTTAAARGRGVRVDVIPAVATFPKVIEALEEYFRAI